MKRSKRLRTMYEEKRFFVSAGVNNALEARIAEAAGFDAIGMSGAGTAALCGMPDAGVTTMTESVNNARYIVNSVSLPVTVDCEVGFGNIHMVRRTVREVIQTGAAGLFLEDQDFLRRCGFIAGKRVLPLEEAVGKYRAAVDVRNEYDPDFILISRCDARGASGGSVEEAVVRGKAYRKVGMDVIYFEALQSLDEIKTCVAEVGPPIYFTWGAIPLEEQPSHEEMAAMGISNVGYWLTRPLRNYPVDRLLWEMLHDVREHGPEAMRRWYDWARSFPWRYSEPPHFHDFMGFDRVREVEEKYLPAETQERYEKTVGLYTPGEHADTPGNVVWR